MILNQFITVWLLRSWRRSDGISFFPSRQMKVKNGNIIPSGIRVRNVSSVSRAVIVFFYVSQQVFRCNICFLSCSWSGFIYAYSWMPFKVRSMWSDFLPLSSCLPHLICPGFISLFVTGCITGAWSSITNICQLIYYRVVFYRNGHLYVCCHWQHSATRLTTKLL